MTVLSRSIEVRGSRKVVPVQNVFECVTSYSPVGTSLGSIVSAYGKTAETSRSLSFEVRRILQLLRVEATIPRLPNLGVGDDAKTLHEQAKLNVKRFCSELAAAFDHPHVGKITEFTERSCLLEWTGFKSRGGILTRKLDVVRHRHELVSMRVTKLSSQSVEIPKEAKHIVAAMGLLMPYCRVVSGKLVSEAAENIGEIEERTGLGKVVDSAKWVSGKASRAVRFAGTAVSSAASRIAATPVFDRDPGILIGDRILYGWNN